MWGQLSRAAPGRPPVGPHTHGWSHRGGQPCKAHGALDSVLGTMKPVSVLQNLSNPS